MKKTTVITLSVCLFMVFMTMVTIKEHSSYGVPIVDAGEDQIVHEGDIVQFNGSSTTQIAYPVWPVDISGNGEYLAIGWDKNVTFFMTASNIPIWTYNTGGDGKVGDLKLSEDGRYLVVGSYMSVFFFETSSDIPLWSVTPAGGFISYDSDPGNRLDMTRDGRFIAAAAAGDRVHIYDTESATPTVPYWNFYFGSEVDTVKFSEDGRYISIGAKNGNLKLGWVSGRTINWTASPGDRVYSSSLSYDGGRISIGQGNTHKVRLYSSSSSVPIWTCQLDGRQFEQVMSDDGEYLASSNHFDNRQGTWSGFAFWNTSTSTPIWTYTIGASYSLNADAIDMDSNANYVVGGSRDNNVYLFSHLADGVYGWRPSDGIPIFTFSTDGMINYNGVSISYNGTYFACGSWGGGVYLFSTENAPHLVWSWFADVPAPVADPDGYKWDFDNYTDSDGDGNFTNDVDATGPAPTHIYGDDGVYTVTLNVTDSQNRSGTDTLLVTVINIAPTIIPFGPFITEEGALLSIAATATDPGSDDLTFTWEWGDGTSDTVNIHYNDGMDLDPFPSPWGTFPLYETDIVHHVYEEYGIYTINLTVEDDDGGIAVYSTNVTVIGVAPPILYIDVSQDKQDAVLYWEPPSMLGIDHYLIYRSTSQTDFDFSKVWVNTSRDMEFGESDTIPLRTMWNDTNSAVPGDPNFKEQYYYVIRSVNSIGKVSRTSRTVGKWTNIYKPGISTFSLPLEPFDILYTDDLTTNMSVEYIKYMDTVSHTWLQHNLGDVNTYNIQMLLGEGFEVKFGSQTIYTFCGMPGAMIIYDDDSGFAGFDYSGDAKNISVTILPNGDVNLTWQEPLGMSNGWYDIYYSNKRDGFFGSFNVDYFLACPAVKFGTNFATHVGAQANNPGSRLYYMVVPVNSSGVAGASAYSIGIWTEEYLLGYDTFGIPLKLSCNQTADWYCDNIPDTVGINYFNVNAQRWSWHTKRMPKEAFDPMLEMTEGYQISNSNTTKFTFIGV